MTRKPSARRKLFEALNSDLMIVLNALLDSKSKYADEAYAAAIRMRDRLDKLQEKQ